MITKGAITEGAFKLLVIWGVTSKPRPEEIDTALGVLDDYALELESTGLLTGYAPPGNYGESDPNDDSGLTDWMAGPFKKLLAVELISIYGKAITPTLGTLASMAIKSLEHALVRVDPARPPATLPKGSGNEFEYRDTKFYSEQPERLDTETDGVLDDITLTGESIEYFP